MRAQSAMGVRAPETPGPYVDTDIKVADTILTPGIRRHLEKFYEQSTNPEDKARCLELLTSLNIGQALKDPEDTSVLRPRTAQARPHQKHVSFRPHTAMATLDRDEGRYIQPYLTTYKKEYTAFQGQPTQGLRPATTRGCGGNDIMAKPVGPTTYQHEYQSKPKSSATAIRTGTASGCRRNNPHPLQRFMVWKLPHGKTPETQRTATSPVLTDEMFDKACRGTLASTYQQDYLGVPQGYQMGSAFADADVDTRSRVPYTLDSSMRSSYRMPDQRPQLKGNTSRYGSNPEKNVPARGGVPTVSRCQMNMKNRTTYAREYDAPSGGRPLDVRQLGRYHGAMALQRRRNDSSCSASGDRPAVSAMLQSLRDRDPAIPRSPGGYHDSPAYDRAIVY